MWVISCFSPKIIQTEVWFYILQTGTIWSWQNFTVLPIKLQPTDTRPLLHPSKLVFWIFFGIQKRFVFLNPIFNNHNPNIPSHHSLGFMISFSIPTIVVMYFPLPHFIHSGVVLSPTKLPMTKNLHLELSHLSIWWWIAIMARSLRLLLRPGFNG